MTETREDVIEREKNGDNENVKHKMIKRQTEVVSERDRERRETQKEKVMENIKR